MLVLITLLGLLTEWTYAQPELARNDFVSGYPAGRLNLLTRASDLIGTTVYDQQGRRLGRIHDFLADPASWRIVCALLRPANLYGPKEYFVAVPARCFRAAGASGAILNVPVTNFIALPRFSADPSQDARAMSRSLVAMYDRFGQKVYWDTNTGLAQIVRCGTWMGMDVQDRSGANVGTLRDFMIDLPAERVVLAAANFFGWQSDIHVMPPQALNAEPGGQGLRLEINQERLAGFANSDAFVWNKTADPAWVASVYRAYGQSLTLSPEPSSDAALAAVRDWTGPGSTSPQLNDEAGTHNPALAEAVLKAFIEKDLAYSGLDIKISVSGSQVTLTGNVPSARQKADLGKIAEQVAGSGNVVNLLEVK